LASKRYYWLKLNENFFRSPRMNILKSTPDGHKYIVFYLEMMLMAINSNGRLLLFEGAPLDAETIPLVFQMNAEDVKTALTLFEKLKLIEYKDKVITIPNFEGMVGSETADARRKRTERALISGQKADNVRTMSTDIEKEIDKDKNKDIDIDTEGERGRKRSASRFFAHPL